MEDGVFMNVHQIDPRSTRATHRLLASALIMAPLLMVMSLIADPLWGQNADTSPVAELTIIEANRTGFTVAMGLMALGMATMAVAAIGMARLVRGGRGTAVTRTGSAIAAMGFFTMAASLWAYVLVGRLFTLNGIPSESGLKIWAGGQEEPFVAAGFFLGTVGLLGLLIVSVGLAMARVVPIWHAVLLGIGGPIWFVGSDVLPDNKFYGFLVFLPLAIAFVLLAPKLLALPAERYVDGVVDVSDAAMKGDPSRPHFT
jgi:hypothetical protein